MKRFSLLATILLFSPILILAQPEAYSHPELNWKTIETDHFTVSFHDGAERSARLAAKIAEEAYPAITSLYKHDPSKVNIVIKDTDDYSNGGAFFTENKIEIWAPSLEFPFRGQHQWLRDVITHEYTHIVTLTAAMKVGTFMPAAFIQAFGYEPTRRNDILYGFPNRLVSYPIAGFNVPFWLAEGVAQYQRPELRYDTWDSHRDMILRSDVLAGKMASLSEISNPVIRSGFGGEQWYNYGFALTRYLAMKYGESSLERLMKNFASISNYNVDAALEDTYHKPAEQLYTEWKQYLATDYKARTQAIEAHFGKIIEQDGMNFSPIFSPDGKKIYYISNGGATIGGYGIFVKELGKDSSFKTASRPTVKDIFVHQRASEYGACKVCGYHFSEGQSLLRGVSSRLSITSDGKHLLYSKYTGTSWKVQKYNDLFIYNIAKDEETRLTYQKRLETPALSPDNRTIVAVTQKDGTENLVELAFTADTTKQHLRVLTSFKNGEKVLTPIYSADGSKIYFALGIRNQRRLMQYDRTSGELSPLTEAIDEKNPYLSIDERDLSLTPDGKHLLFASNPTGIFNLYRLNLETKNVEQLTNVLTGAFMPSMDKSGKLAYAHFTHTGYKLALLDSAAPIQNPNAVYRKEPTPIAFEGTRTDAPQLASLNSRLDALPRTSSQNDSLYKHLIEYDDTVVPQYRTSEYTKIFSPINVIPLIRFDAYTKPQGGFWQDAWRAAKFGAAFNSSEVLGQFNLFGVFAFAPGSNFPDGAQNPVTKLLEMERDAYLSFEYSDQTFLPASMLPKFTLDIFHITRNVPAAGQFGGYQTDFSPNDSTTYNVSFAATQFDLSLRFRIPINNLFFQASSFRTTFSLGIYSSKINSFFWEPLGQTLPASSDNYFIGRSASLFWKLDLRARSFNQNINPIGFLSRVRLDYENSKLQTGNEFVESNGTFRPVYDTFDFVRLTADLNYYFPLPTWSPKFQHTLSLRTFGAFNFGNETDFFFHNFISGLIGMRGYEFFAIGGDRAAFAHLEYRVPIFTNLDVQFFHLYFNHLYFSTYFDIGAAWGRQIPSLNNWRKDVGFELRLASNSFYAFPTSIFISATYGLDRFNQPLRRGFEQQGGQPFVTYGREWLFHFGMLFDFDFLADETVRGARLLLR